MSFKYLREDVKDDYRSLAGRFILQTLMTIALIGICITLCIITNGAILLLAIAAILFFVIREGLARFLYWKDHKGE